MCPSNAFLGFPRRIEVPETLGGGVYTLRTDCYGLRGRARALEREHILSELEGGTTAVLRGEPGEDERSEARPVYELPGGAPGVPTGLLFARFREGTDAAAQAPALHRVGYEIVEIPRWAPHAAWIRAAGGDVSRSLANVAALERVEGLERVEPQMLTRAARRR